MEGERRWSVFPVKQCCRSGHKNCPLCLFVWFFLKWLDVSVYLQQTSFYYNTGAGQPVDVLNSHVYSDMFWKLLFRGSRRKTANMRLGAIWWRFVLLLLLIDTVWGCRSLFASILQVFCFGFCLFVYFFVVVFVLFYLYHVCTWAPLTSTDRAQCVSIQSVFQTRYQTCSWSPVLLLTQSRSSVSDRGGFHTPLVSSNDCAIKPKSIFLILFPARVVFLGCVTRVCVWLPGFPHLPSWSCGTEEY